MLRQEKFKWLNVFSSQWETITHCSKWSKLKVGKVFRRKINEEYWDIVYEVEKYLFLRDMKRKLA